LLSKIISSKIFLRNAVNRYKDIAKDLPADNLYNLIRDFVRNGTLPPDQLAGLVNSQISSFQLNGLNGEGDGLGLAEMNAQTREEVLERVRQLFALDRIRLQLSPEKVQELAMILVGLGILSDVPDLNLVVTLKGGDQFEADVDYIGKLLKLVPGAQQKLILWISEADKPRFLARTIAHREKIQFQEHEKGFVDENNELLDENVNQVLKANRNLLESAWFGIPHYVKVDFEHLQPGSLLHKMRVGYITSMLGFVPLPRGGLGMVGELTAYLKTLINA